MVNARSAGIIFCQKNQFYDSHNFFIFYGRGKKVLAQLNIVGHYPHREMHHLAAARLRRRHRNRRRRRLRRRSRRGKRGKL